MNTSKCLKSLVDQYDPLPWAKLCVLKNKHHDDCVQESAKGVEVGGTAAAFIPKPSVPTARAFLSQHKL